MTWQVTLRDPVVACKFGYLYNKEALLEALVTKKLEDNFKHVKSLKDVHAAKLTANPAYTDSVKQSELGKGANATHFMCPVTQLPMNGKYKFVLIAPTETVLSERGLKETSSTNEAGQKICPMTSQPYKEEEVLMLHQHLMDPEKFAEEHRLEMKRLAEEKKRKKDKKKGKKEDDEGAEQGPKRMKVDPTAAIAEKSKSAVFSGLFRSKEEKGKKTTAEDLLMLAPGSKHGQAAKFG